jgi:hypothetical protein
VVIPKYIDVMWSPMHIDVMWSPIEVYVDNIVAKPLSPIEVYIVTPH